MCLEKVIETFKPNDNMIMGYKVYDKLCEGKYKDIFQGYNRKIGQLYKAKGKLIYQGNREYDCGFHVFKSIVGTKNFLYFENRVVCKVHLWDIRVIGKDRSCIVYVGKNLRIVEEMKK